MDYKYFPKNKEELKVVIKDLIEENGNSVDLNCIDVSKIENMGYLFFDSEFNGNISKWNVSNVKNMRWMFRYSKFNGDISEWDLSNVVDISLMFHKSNYKRKLPKMCLKRDSNIAVAFLNSKIDYIEDYKSLYSHKIVRNINLIV